VSKWQYTKGLHDLGRGCYSYLQPDGSWGWSNAGLIVDGEANLLVDTLFDLKLTREMLEQMRAAVPAARSIGRLVNTHSNGDHTFGNQLVKDAEIIASRACAEEMKEKLGGLSPAEYYAKNGPLTVERMYEPPDWIVWDDKTYRGDAYATFGWGCDVVDLEVDPDTFEVKLHKITAVQPGYGRFVTARYGQASLAQGN